MLKLKSNYLKFNIHYRLHKTLVAPQEIDISLKRITNCSVHCPLNVTILEYIGTGFSREVRYHSWSRVYRVTWQMIAEKFRGYSIGIISKCAACTQMCDVAVALGLPLTSNKFMFKTSNVYGKYLDHIKLFIKTLKIDYQTLLPFNDFQQLLLNLTNIPQSIDSSDLMYGSWYDAYAYCAERNTSLLTLHPKQYGRLLGLIDSGNHSWINTHMDEHYFAGLHRADSVSTNYCTWLKSSRVAVNML